MPLEVPPGPSGARTTSKEPTLWARTASKDSVGEGKRVSTMIQDSMMARPRRSSLGAMDGSVKVAAMTSIQMQASRTTRQSIDVVIDGLLDSERSVKDAAVAAAAAILVLADSDVREAMTKRLQKDADASARYDILEALVQLALKGEAKATVAIESFRVDDGDPSVRMKAAKALQDIATRCKKDAGVRQEAAQAVKRGSKVRPSIIS